MNNSTGDIPYFDNTDSIRATVRSFLTTSGLNLFTSVG